MGAYTDAVLDTPGLVSYWPADELPGALAHADLAGPNPANFNTVGLTLGDAPIIAGEDASTLWAGAGAGFANAPHTASMDLGVDLTVEAWFKTSANATSRTITRRQNAWQLRIASGGALQGIIWQATVQKNVVSAVNINDNAVHHVAMTFESATKLHRLWLDGKLATSGVLAAAGIDVNANSITLDGTSGGVEQFRGNLAGHALYGVALSGARVQHHYRLGAGLERRAITERLFTFKAGTPATIDGSVRCPLAGGVDLSDAYAGGGIVTADDEVARRLRALGIFDETAA